MPFADSTLIDRLLNNIEQQLKDIDEDFISLAALVVAIDDAAVVHALAWAEDEDDSDMAGPRIRALIRMARERHEKLAETIGKAFRMICERKTLFEHLKKQDDPNALVREALDEATFVLEQSGVDPFILMFDKSERHSLGESPWARLVALQEQAIRSLEHQASETFSEAKETLAEALKLTQLLAAGAETRDWSDQDDEASGED